MRKRPASRGNTARNQPSAGGIGATFRGVSSAGPVGLADTPAQEVLGARVREACTAFGNAYWRDLDRQRAYPEEFVRREFTRIGSSPALIPDEYGGLGLPLSDAAIVTEEINHAGGNAGTAHAQMYIMGTVLRPATRTKSGVVAAIARGASPAGFGVTEPGRHRHDADPHGSGPERRPLHGQRREALDLEGQEVGSHAVLGSHYGVATR